MLRVSFPRNQQQNQINRAHNNQYDFFIAGGYRYAKISYGSFYFFFIHYSIFFMLRIDQIEEARKKKKKQNFSLVSLKKPFTGRLKRCIDRGSNMNDRGSKSSEILETYQQQLFFRRRSSYKKIQEEDFHKRIVICLANWRMTRVRKRKTILWA